MNVKFTDKNNVTNLLPCTYDQDAQIINFDLPKLATGTGNYKFEVTVPTATASMLKTILYGNGSATATNDFSTIKTVVNPETTVTNDNSSGGINTNVSSGTVVKTDATSQNAGLGTSNFSTQTSPLVAYDFKVSAYGTFAEKMRFKQLELTTIAMDYAEDFGLGAQAMVLGKKNPASEGFDLAELKGNKFCAFQPLIAGEATLTDDYFIKSVNPTIYKNFLPVNVTFSREITDLGVPPSKGIFTRSDFIASVENENYNSNFSSSTPMSAEFPFHYDLPKYYFDDFTQIMDAIISFGGHGTELQPISDCSGPDCKDKGLPIYNKNEKDFITNGFPTMPFGIYPTKFNYILPNGVVNSSALVNYNYSLANSSPICSKPPTITCPQNLTVKAAENSITANASWSVTAKDYCINGRSVAVVSNPASGTNFNIGSTIVTSTASDANSNQSSCTFTVNVVTGCVKLPTITCPQNITVTAPSNSTSAPAAWTTTAVDNCVSGRSVTVTSVPASGSVFNIGSTTVTSTASDANSNQSSCTFTITVIAPCVKLPTITCPQNITVTAPSNSTSAPATWSTTAVDNCVSSRSVAVASVPASGSNFNIGSTTVTSTATDANNNKSSCTFTVNVIAAACIKPPTITCPQNMTITAQPFYTAAYAAWTTTAVDNCVSGRNVAVVSVPTSGTLLNVGKTTVTSTATDVNNNQSSCTFTVTVITPCVKPPSITCPQNITVTAPSNSTSTSVSWSTTAVDNCVSGRSVTVTSVPASGSVFNIGSTTVTSTATDANNIQTNCTFTVNVVAPCTKPPTITCPQNMTITAQPFYTAAYAAWTTTAVDNCVSGRNVAVVSVPTSGTLLNVGKTTVTSTATDANNNQSSCTFTVTVITPCVKPPSITCPQNITVTAPSNSTSAPAAWTTTAVDNCVSGRSVTVTSVPASGSVFNIGSTTVTSTATDANNIQTNCTFTVNVVALCTKPPTISCPSSVTVTAPESSTSTTASWNASTAIDNCSGKSLSVTTNYQSGQAFNVGTTTVTSTVTDANNKTVQCTFNVTVLCSTPPTIVCPSSITVTAQAGSTTAAVNWNAATANDNCGNGTVSISNSKESGSVFTVGTTTVTSTATDKNNKTKSCSFTVTVNPSLPTGCESISISSANGDITLTGLNPGKFITTIQVFAAVSYSMIYNGTNGITATSFTVPNSTLGSGTNFIVRATVYRYDNAPGWGENSCTKDYPISVTPQCTTPPTITCPQDITVTAPQGSSYVMVSYNEKLIAKDNCSTGSINITNNPVDGSSFTVGTTTKVTSFVTDGKGNKSQPCSFNVKVLCSSPPRITCADRVITGPTYSTITIDMLSGVSAYDCYNNAITPTSTPSNGTYLIDKVLNIIPVQINAQDSFGRSSVCNFNIRYYGN